jgi:hypothetical protein
MNSISSSRYGSGDSLLLFDVVPDMAEDLLDSFLGEGEVVLQDMHHKGGAIPRLFATQGLLQREEGSGDILEPVYR